MSGPLVLAPQPAFLERVKGLALNAVPSASTRRVYNEALNLFLSWYEQAGYRAFTRAAVQGFVTELERRGLSPSTMHVYLSAVRKLVSEAAANKLLEPDVAAAITRVRAARVSGARAGTWLTADQASSLLRLPKAQGMQGTRDRAILAILIGCGLRRSEVAKLRIEDFALREARWVLCDLAGKATRIRTVPVPAWVKALVDEWLVQARISAGRVFRAINKGGAVWGDGMSPDAIWAVARKYGARIGQPKLAPHDLRRTCAKLCRTSGGSLEQIQMLLGHASVQTTEQYLGSRQEIARAVNDNLPIQVPVPEAQPSRKGPQKATIAAVESYDLAVGLTEGVGSE